MALLGTRKKTDLCGLEVMHFVENEAYSVQKGGGLLVILQPGGTPLAIIGGVS